jgi:polyisoprenoid-binding protein YceI
MRKFTGLGVALAGFLLWGGPQAGASPLRFTVLPEKSQVEFISGTQLGDFQGNTHQLSGSMVVDPTKNGATVHLTVSVDLRTLTSDNALRDRHMRQSLLEVDRYPRAIFTAGEFRPAPGARQEGGGGTLSGVLTLHGVERPVSLPIHFTVNGTTLQGEGTLRVRLTDFKMTPPRLLGIKVRDQVTVQIHLVAANG